MFIQQVMLNSINIAKLEFRKMKTGKSGTLLAPAIVYDRIYRVKLLLM